jgi:hypothetical protein
MKRGFFADLFTNVTNEAWDLARILSAWGVLSVSMLAGYKIFKGQELSLSEYAQAMMTVFTGCALFIGAKDVARAHSIKKDADK